MLHKSYRVWASLTIIALVITSCGIFNPTPTLTPVIPPTATVPPTPLPPIAPNVIDQLPARGDEQKLTDPNLVYFDAPMDRASTEKAFAMTGVTGKFVWSDKDTVLQFTPDKPLGRAAKYAVKIGAEAKSKAGLALAREVVFNVETVGYLEVTHVLPAPDTVEAAVDSVITVMFNRPVVPLTGLADQATLPNPLSLTPQSEGKGEWLNTSIYVFRPSQPLAGGQTYTGRVAAGLGDVTGGELPSDFEWSFTVAPPNVVSSEPAFGANNIALTTPISVTFNQPMDRASTEAAFGITQPGQPPEPGSFGWADDGKSFAFIPAETLSLGSTYKVTVGAATLAAGGGASLGQDYTFEFETVKAPAILSTDPADGAQNVEASRGFRIYFTSPMDESTLDPNIEIVPTPTQVYTYFSAYDLSYYIGWDLQPSSSYQVTLKPGMKDPYGNEALSEPHTVSFVTAPRPPEAFFTSGGSVGVYSAYLPTELFITTVNVDAVDFELYPLTVQEFYSLTGPNQYDFSQNFAPSQPSVPGGPGRVAIASELNERILTNVPLQPSDGTLAPGLYYLRMTAPGINFPTYQLLAVSKSALTLKTGLDSALVWATDLNSGQPVPNLNLTLYDSKFGALGNGSTDAQGIFKTNLPKRESVWDQVYALTPQGDAFSIALSDWSTGLDPWDFNVASRFYTQDTTAYLYTDRPIYRPGQVVFFKGAVRNEKDARFSVPSVREVPVFITNDRGERVYESRLALTAFGTFSGEFTIADGASLGFYSITVEDPVDPNRQFGNVSFSVAEYRKPEFQVSVTTPRNEVVRGETIPVTVDASFFFGGPVTGANVRWTVLAADRFFPYEPQGGAPTGYYDFSDFDYTSGEGGPLFGTFGRVILERDAVIDANGRSTLNVPANLSDSGDSQLYTIEAALTDPQGGAQVAGRVEVTVHAGDFYIGARPDEYVGEAGRPVGVSIVAVKWDSSPQPNQKLKVEFFEHQWNCALERDPETGSNAWTCNAQDTLVANTEVTTDGNGVAKASFTPTKGGTYKVAVSGVDGGGRTVKTATYLWVTSGDYVTWRQSNDDRISLVADKRDYRPGDTAEILIPSPFQGAATALVTVERGGILKHEVITLNTNSTVYQLPITAGYAPEVYFSVVIVKGVDANNPAPALKMGLVKLSVSPEQQEIQLTLTPDKTKVGPRETVNYTLKATNFAGQPVAAEFSVGVVDLAVLQLSAPNSQNVRDFFYGERGLGVRTASGLTLSVDRINVDAAQAKGGGGGAEAGFDEVRGNFLDTAFWRSTVTTDANGEASVSVTLPDNLTTWRLDARGLTADTLVGQGTVDIVATKDLLIRPVTPRFFVIGDKAELSAVVNNNTANAIDATVSLQANGVTIDTAATQQVTIPANGRAEVKWNVTATDADFADLTFTVQGGGLQDASKPTLALPPEQRLPILKYSAPETMGTAGELTDTTPRLEAISLPRRYDVTQGNLRVEVAPSLAAATTPALKALENPEYDSSEAIVSSFLPNVVSLRALKKLGLADAQLERELEALVNEAVQKLLARQNVDGGWGWWGTEESNPYLTAYALFGLSQAKQNEFSVNDSAINNAVSYLQGQLINPATAPTSADGWRLNRQAFILYALGDAGQPDISATVTLYEARERLDAYAKAYLALTLAQADRNDPRLKTLLGDLNNAAILSATGAHWEERGRDWWNLNTDTRSTAIVLMALARLDGQNNLIPNVVRWLMTARTAQTWETTQETVWAVIALTDWMEVSGELKADYNYRVSLNGNTLFADQANAGNLREEKSTEVAVAQLFADEANRLVFERGAGEGRLYYTAHLNVFLPVADARAINRGVIVGRTYSIISDDCGGADQTQCPPVTEAKAGDDIRVKVTLVAPNDLYFVTLEDPIPAGTEPVDTSLLTTSVVGQPPELDPRDPFYYGWGWWWFSRSEIRDDKVVLFADYLPRGTYEYTYTLHASRPGTYNVIPTWARETYFPEVFGRGDGAVFVIMP
ncbi:MAG: Ig-like domain-containing protein [Anaerolineales bacterium]